MQPRKRERERDAHLNSEHEISDDLPDAPPFLQPQPLLMAPGHFHGGQPSMSHGALIDPLPCPRSVSSSAFICSSDAFPWIVVLAMAARRSSTLLNAFSKSCFACFATASFLCRSQLLAWPDVVGNL
eukprot:COSAG06_NODE_14891_length_1116_cov_20.725664_1_plen_127_part_00